jgi:putative thioredoxin
MSQYIVNVTAENFQQVILESSTKQPVLVDFWADWCGPCKQLTPILEKLANEYQGRFILAKVNCDEQQMIAAQFGVRNLPTVYLVDKGQPVDGFSGAQPETVIRTFLEQHLPDPIQGEMDEAMTLLAAGDTQGAITKLKSAAQIAKEPHPINVILAKAYILENRLDDAERLLATIPTVYRDADYQSVKSELELKKNAADTPAIRELNEQLNRNPADDHLRLQLAVQLHSVGRNKEALETLLVILRKDLGFADGEAKKTFMDILSVLGQGNVLAAQYRRALFSLLY